MSFNVARDSNRKDYGDFQTPRGLVSAILDVLERFGPRPVRILEPTCGVGNFLAEILDRPDPPREIRAYEIQPGHAATAGTVAPSSECTTVVVKSADLFEMDLSSDLRWENSGPLLVVGNLPWVTTSALGLSGGVNGPDRTNHRKRRGIDAMTGDSNFDISEAIWIKLIKELAHEEPTIALLCKTAVARNVLRSISASELPITRASLWKIDSRRWFRAAVDACLLRLQIGPGSRATTAPIFEDLEASSPESILGFEDGRLISDRATYDRVAFGDGSSPLQWRQGVKHDASSIMELVSQDDGQLANRLGERVEIEDDFVYPLRKATDLASPREDRDRLRVIITQTRLGDETRTLETSAPRLWSYLQSHREAFERRKSSIYRGRPPFAMFGVGDYSFAPYKVAISGLHKNPRFQVLGTEEGRPTMVDDTCYFLPCRSLGQARVLESILNGSVALDLIRSLGFRDAKRPVTKALLQRIDLKAILVHAGLSRSWETEWETDWSPRSRIRPGV